MTDLGDDVEMMRKVIAQANNSLFGSLDFFLSINGREPDEYHLARAIEGLKDYGRKEFLRAEKAENAVKEALAILATLNEGESRS